MPASVTCPLRGGFAATAVMLGLFLPTACPPGSAEGLRVGVSQLDITPPTNTPMAGYYHVRGSQGAVDPLWSKAMVLDDGSKRMALVCLDLIETGAPWVRSARQAIEARTGIPAGNVMISATHQHTGPALPKGLPGVPEVDGADSEPGQRYLGVLVERIVESVASADARREPVHLGVGHALEPDLAKVRRFWMKDGTVGWNPGKLNPAILRPTGVNDPDVGVLYAETPGTTAAAPGRPVMTYVNYAMHPDTTGGVMCSADYPGALSRILALYRGPEMVTLFANGTCGDLNHIDVRWAGRQGGTNEANRLGTILAASVFKAYTRLEPVAASTLRVASTNLHLPKPPVSAAEVESARLVVRTTRDSDPGGFMKLVQAYKVLRIQALGEAPVPVEVQVIALGEQVAWVALPGEIFVDLGLSIKAGSPFRHTFVVELANGSVGYVPNRSAYAQGNYEVVSTILAEGGGERMVEAALGLLTQLRMPPSPAR